jgi:hypothetical protein
VALLRREKRHYTQTPQGKQDDRNDQVNDQIGFWRNTEWNDKKEHARRDHIKHLRGEDPTDE